MKGTLTLSWGRWGGIYATRWRICLGWVAVTWWRFDVDRALERYLELDRRAHEFPLPCSAMTEENRNV